MINVFCRKDVFRYLVFHDATAGLFNGHASQLHVSGLSGQRHGAGDPVNIFLSQRQKLVPGNLCAFDQCINLGINTLNSGAFFCSAISLLFTGHDYYPLVLTKITVKTLCIPELLAQLHLRDRNSV